MVIGLLYLCVWLAWTGVMLLNVYIEEALGRNTRQATYILDNANEVAILCYNFVGGFGWVFCLSVLTFSVVGKKKDVAVTFGLYLGAVFYIHMTVFGFVGPNRSWRLLDNAEAAPGGEASIGCYVAKDLKHMGILPNVTYYSFLDVEWSVDWDKRITRAPDYGWTWLIAPVVYNGSAKGCVFDPPIYATCVTKRLDPAACYFNTPQRPYMTMRKVRHAEYMEQWDFDRYPLKGPDVNDRLFEWNSPTLYDTQKFIETVLEEKSNQWRNVCISWFILSTAILVYFLVVDERIERWRQDRHGPRVLGTTNNTTFPLMDTGSEVPYMAPPPDEAHMLPHTEPCEVPPEPYEVSLGSVVDTQHVTPPPSPPPAALSDNFFYAQREHKTPASSLGDSFFHARRNRSDPQLVGSSLGTPPPPMPFPGDYSFDRPHPLVNQHLDAEV